MPDTDLSQYGTVSTAPLDMSAYGVVSGAPEQPSLTSDALKYSPVGMVKGLADMISTAASGQNPFKGMAEANVRILDKAKSSIDSAVQAFKDHDYAGAANKAGEAAFHFGNYLQPLGGAFEDVSQDLQDGNIGHAAAKFAGLTSSLALGAKGPAALDAATRPGAGGDILAATKGAAQGAKDAAVKPITYGHLRLPIPQPLAGAATGGYAARMLGLPSEAGAVVGGAYPIVKGAIGGAQDALAARALAAREALSSSREVPPPQAPFQPAGLLPAGAIRTEPPADTSFVRSAPLEEVNPQMAAQVGKPQLAAPAQAPTTSVPAELLDGVSQSLAGKPFARLDANAQATVRQIATKIAAEEAAPKPVAAAPAAPAAAPAVVPQPSPVIPAQAQPPAVVPPPTAVMRNGQPSVAEQLRDLLVPGEKPDEAGVVTINPENTEAAPKRSMAQLEADMAKKAPAPTEAPTSKYNAQGELKSPQQRAMEIENANRTAKAARFVEPLNQLGINYEQAKLIEPGRLSDSQIAAGMTPRWGNIADYLKENEPSDTTVNEIIKQLRKQKIKTK